MNEDKPQTNLSQGPISLHNEREVLDLVGNSIMNLWEVVNNLTRLRPTQRERYRVRYLVPPVSPGIIGSMLRCAIWPRNSLDSVATSLREADQG
jgi:hypothetical protein